MSKKIPTIRAVVLAPLITWMTMNLRPVNKALQEAGLGFLSLDDPFQIIPLESLSRLLASAARQEGPDLPVRLIEEADVLNGAMIAPIVTAAKSPRQACSAIAASLPMLSSHEHLAVEDGPKSSVVRHFWGASMDPLALHCLQQFTAGMVEKIVDKPTDLSSAIQQIEMMPHPDYGLDFLKGRYHGRVVEGTRILAVHVSSAALQRPYRNGSRNRQANFEIPDLDSLRDTNLSGTVRVLIRSMLEVGTPKLDDIARTANTSPRSFQRTLAMEGTGFRQLLDEVRRDAALDWLEADKGRITQLAQQLGYTNSSALTRAMRRWVGETPKKTRDRFQQGGEVGST